MTQGRQIIAALKRKPHTYMEMLMLGVSVSPWKRAVESLREGEKLIKHVHRDGRMRWFVTKA